MLNLDLTNSYVNPGGSNFTFVVGASGTLNLGVFWYFEETNLLKGFSTNRSPLTTSLTVTNVQADKLGRYSVVITNGYGPVTSSVVDLVYRQGASLVQGPTDQTVVAGQAASFSVVAGGGGPYTYA